MGTLFILADIQPINIGIGIGNGIQGMAASVILSACIIRASLTIINGFRNGNVDYFGVVGTFTPYLVIVFWFNIVGTMLGVNAGLKTQPFDKSIELYKSVITKYQSSFDKAKEENKFYIAAKEFAKSNKDGINDAYLIQGMNIGSFMVDAVDSDAFFFGFEMLTNPAGWILRNTMFIYELLAISIIFLVRHIMVYLSDFILGFLFAVGPLAMAFSMFPGMEGLRTQWFSRWLNITCWLVTISIIDQFTLEIISDFAASANQGDVGSMNFSDPRFGNAMLTYLMEFSHLFVLLIMYLAVPFFTDFYTQASGASSFMSKTAGAAVAVGTLGAGAIANAASAAKASGQASALQAKAADATKSAGQAKSMGTSQRTAGDGFAGQESKSRAEASSLRSEAKTANSQGDYAKADKLNNQASKAEEKANSFAQQKESAYRNAGMSDKMAEKLSGEASSYSNQAQQIKDQTKSNNKARTKGNLGGVRQILLHSFD